jgi:hypothetical protein
MKTIRQFLAGRAAGAAKRRAKHQIIGLTPFLVTAPISPMQRYRSEFERLWLLKVMNYR